MIKPLKFMEFGALLAVACGSGAAPAQGTDPGPIDTAGIRLEVVTTGFSSPVHLIAPNADQRLFIVEQRGTIRILKNGQRLVTPFLDIRSRVRSGGEQGLFSVAFHPAYATNGFFYVNYTDTQGDTRVERYRADPSSDVADAGSAQLILRVDQPFANHNGGHILFGPDGQLYIAMGDGGSGGDPQGNGQNPQTLLGKLLRIAPNGGAPEIWALGLRNPWRIAFDRTDGLLYIADVGQSNWEEINVVAAGARGLNYGWSIMEGRHCFRVASCDQTGLTLPVFEYDHSGGNCSVTGGFVYRGARIPSLRGHYFYADYCSGRVRSFRYTNNAVTEHRTWGFGDLGSITSFGEDALGELYVLTAGGTVYRLTQ
ncbi:MAG: PQQ-dependent sugar dehydrogenase [Gemmatimonadota bacterium]